eukprot:gene27418-33791_t
MAKRLATDDEIRQLEKWNNTDYPFPQKCLQELFKEQVEKTPDSTALVFETQSLTYRELDSRAAELGAHLRDLGVSPDVLVAVKVDRNAGGAYVPIDPAYPADRRQYMIEDSQAKVLVTQASLYADDDGSEVPEGVVVVVLDEATGYLSPHSPSKAMYGANDLAPATLALTVTPDCLAYVIYTSGSTGKPKGVMLPHSNVVNLLYAFYMELGASAKDTLLAITTFCFDISVLEIFLPLIFGMKLVLASRMDATNGDLLQDLMARHDVTIMQATPTTWQMLMQVGWKGKANMQALCGGEPCPTHLAPIMMQVQSFWNVYGPTETTIWSSQYRVPATPNGPLPIGKPLINNTFFVLDENRERVGIGCEGELWI